MVFEHQEEYILNNLLDKLFVTSKRWKRLDITRYIDGFITEKSEFGPCIIEFDEEQHFSPFRKITLEQISKTIDVRFDIKNYINLCNDSNYFNEFFLKKHRLKVSFKEMPSSQEFIKELRQLKKSNNGYIAPKPNFDFIGGRIAQRAYYDTLRDFYYLSRDGKKIGLKPIIRFSKYQIEKNLNTYIEKSNFKELTKTLYNILGKCV